MRHCLAVASKHERSAFVNHRAWIAPDVGGRIDQPLGVLPFRSTARRLGRLTREAVRDLPGRRERLGNLHAHHGSGLPAHRRPGQLTAHGRRGLDQLSGLVGSPSDRRRQAPQHRHREQQARRDEPAPSERHAPRPSFEDVKLTQPNAARPAARGSCNADPSDNHRESRGCEERRRVGLSL